MKLSNQDLKNLIEMKILSETTVGNMRGYLESKSSETPEFKLGHVIYYFGAMLIIIAMFWFLTDA